MNKTFIITIFAALTLASCSKMARQDFAPVQMKGSEDYCVQVIMQNEAFDIYGSSDTAITSLPLIGKTHRVAFTDNNPREGYALLDLSLDNSLQQIDDDKIKMRAYRVIPGRHKTYRLRNVRQDEKTLSFDVMKGKTAYARVLATANFKGMKTLMECIGKNEEVYFFEKTFPALYRDILQLAFVDADPNSCQCLGQDFLNATRDATWRDSKNVPIIMHHGSISDIGCGMKSTFYTDSPFNWWHSSANNEYSLTDSTLVVHQPERQRDTILSLAPLSAEQKDVLRQLVLQQEIGLEDEDIDAEIYSQVKTE